MSFQSRIKRQNLLSHSLQRYGRMRTKIGSLSITLRRCDFSTYVLSQKGQIGGAFMIKTLTWRDLPWRKNATTQIQIIKAVVITDASKETVSSGLCWAYSTVKSNECAICRSTLSRCAAERLECKILDGLAELCLSYMPSRACCIAPHN
jgi:hypothetical protein